MNVTFSPANLGENLALEVCPPTCDMGIPIWNDRIASKQLPAQRLRMAAITGLQRDGNPVRMRQTCMTLVKRAAFQGLGPPAAVELPTI